MPSSSGPGADLPLAERERAYSPSSCIGGNYQPFMQAYTTLSAAVRQRFAGRCGLSYGPAASNTLDLFMPPRTDAAPPRLLLFIHGGYWQELSKNESLFAGAGCMAAGAAFAALDYTLAPAAPVAEMVRECRAALRWLHGHAAELGVDATRIVVAGSSAGAHLAAMCCLRGWPGDADLPAGLPAAAVLVSGNLRACAAGRYRHRRCAGTDATECCGRQPGPLRQAGRNHFDVILDLARAGTALGDATLRLLRGT